MTTASDTIIGEATSWPGVEAGPGPRGGELSIRFGRRELGHLHGDRAAHFGFPKAVWRELREQGRIVPHPVFPDRAGPAARAIRSEEDVRDVIALLRLNYERMQAPPRGVRPTPPQVLPFDPSLHIRAFALERDAEPLLVYSVDGLRDEPVARQYLGHWHEALFARDGAGAPVFVHAADAPQASRRLHVRATFSRRHALGEDFEAIPMPGHTPGSTAYLFDSGRERVLFTGDTIYLRDGEWEAAVLDDSDRAAYSRSLRMLGELDFDVLVPWAATAGDPWFARTDRDDARRRIDALIEFVGR
jgi:hypothetical protein